MLFGMLKVALVGRPNVGKSALFNRIAKRRISIVDEMEGVTRDRLYAKSDLFGTDFEIIDTGGLGNDEIEHIRDQTMLAIEEADRLIMVVDGQVGLTVGDEEVAKLLLRQGKKVVLAVNKVDSREQETMMHSFYSLGIEEMFAVSASHGYQIAELLQGAIDGYEGGTEEEDERIKVAIIGRPNVGKSTFINYLMGEERCLVSPIAGTTRDHVDIPFEVAGQPYLLIDTAGIRRKTKEKNVVEKFAAIRTERSIERADVCVMMLDSQDGLTHQEKRILTSLEEKGKGVVLLFNKWDLVKGFRMEHCQQALEMEASFLKYCPTLFASALTGKNLDNLFPAIQEVYHASHQRIATGPLNRIIEEAMLKVHPPMIKGKRLRIYYLAQIKTAPPRFVFFLNNPDLLSTSYQKYLVNALRKSYPFPGCPLHIHTRRKARVS